MLSHRNIRKNTRRQKRDYLVTQSVGQASGPCQPSQLGSSA
ncbi:hypothetical protein BN136_1465 [Cronobacter universalis NCTC 9529]|nr:hypothetical protein BN136_1465 [Cronobacter universalis NCTC 9529]